MKDQPLVSAIITTYKRNPEMLLRAIKSVQFQTYRNLEIIIVDDNANDSIYRENVQNCIRQLDDVRVNYIQHETNLGACAARNTGINASNSGFIAFLDDDDEWLPLKIEKQMIKMHDSQIGLVYCGRMIVNDDNGDEVFGKTKFINGFVFDKLIKENFIGSTSFVLIRKSCFDVCGGFNVFMQSAQDGEMWLRIAKKYKIDYVYDVLVKYHVHSGEQITKMPLKKIQGLEMLNEIYKDYLSQKKNIKSIRIIKITPYYVMTGERKKAVRNCINAILLSPFHFKINLKYLFIALFKSYS